MQKLLTVFVFFFSLHSYSESSPPSWRSRQESYCEFMFAYDMLNRTLRDESVQVFAEKDRLQGIEETRNKLCSVSCFDSSEDCTDKCLRGELDHRCRSFAFTPMEAIRKMLDARYARCRKRYNAEVFANLAPSLVTRLVCGSLWGSLDGYRDMHERYLKWECRDMRKDNSHNATAIEMEIARLEKLHPTFASIAYGKLAWISHYWCAFRSRFSGAKETACYQQILDSKLVPLKELLPKSKRAQQVCAQFGIVIN